MPQESELHFNLVGEVEERSDRWAIYSREFGFYAYGKTREEANEDFYSGVTDILSSFDQHERMVAYLSNRGIKYNFTPDNEQPIDPVHFRGKSIIQGMFYEDRREVQLAFTS
jgi:hypothetical protein